MDAEQIINSAIDSTMNSEHVTDCKTKADYQGKCDKTNKDVNKIEVYETSISKFFIKVEHLNIQINNNFESW